MNKDQPLTRYSRQTILPEIGMQGQKAISAGRVLCIGAGGLGSPALQYLAAAGVGHIGIIDHDAVDESNLQRQILFTESDIGKSKAKCAAQTLSTMNSAVTITPHDQKLTADNAEDLFAQYDVIIDATDNFTTKFLINDAAYKVNKPWVYGSILGFAGQMSVFDPSHSQMPCYRCLFPHPPTQNILNCAEAGVIGAVAGVIGAMQALEAIKLLVKNPDLPPMLGQFLQLDVQTFEKRLTKLPKDLKCSTCSQPREMINIKDIHMVSGLEITPQEAKDSLAADDNIQLVDVREADEWAQGHIDGAEHCPLSMLMEGFRPENLRKDAKTILYCKGGVRSLQALQILKTQGYADLQSVQGGIEAWKRLA